MIGLGLPKGSKTIDVSAVFEDGEVLHEAYSNQAVKVIDGQIKLSSDFDIVLLERQ